RAHPSTRNRSPSYQRAPVTPPSYQTPSGKTPLSGRGGVRDISPSYRVVGTPPPSNMGNVRQTSPYKALGTPSASYRVVGTPPPSNIRNVHQTAPYRAVGTPSPL